MASDAPGDGPGPEELAPADGAGAASATGAGDDGGHARPPRKHGALRATGFLLAMLGLSLIAVPLLTWPLADLMARALTVVGIHTPGPSRSSVLQWALSYDALPQTFVAMIVPAELLLLGLASVGAVWLGGDSNDRLGLLRPRGGSRVIVLALVTQLLVLSLGALLQVLILSTHDRAWVPPDRFTWMMRQASLPWWITVVCVMAVLPGFCEEVFYRGLIQRRLLLSWSPWMAIVVIGLIFAASHPPLGRSIALLPGSLWIGYVAWRTDSTLPGVILHACTNAGVQSLARFVHVEPRALEEPSRWTIALWIAAIASVCLGLALVLHRWTSPAVSPASPARPTMLPDPNPGGP